jgi:hypothetical protein
MYAHAMADEPNPPDGPSDRINVNPPAEESQQAWDQWYYPQAQGADESASSQEDNFDKSMLTLSSASLGVSLAFIKDTVPLDKAVWKPLLLASWVTFALCIVTTVVSFRFSIAASKRRRSLLDEMFRTKNRELEATQENGWNKAVRISARIALALFLAGLTSTMIFLVKNVSSLPLKTRDEAARPCANLNIHMSNEGKAGKVTEPELIRGREPMRITPPPKAPAKPAPGKQ